MKLPKFLAPFRTAFPMGLLALATFCTFGPVNVYAQRPDTEVRLYGWAILNAAYNTGAPAPVDVPVTATGGEEGSFIMTARQSRFGIDFSHENGIRAAGTLEFDLFGLGSNAAAGGPNHVAPRTRMAFFTLGFAERSTLLFGQFWNVVAPLHPTSLAHLGIPPLSSSGNLANRVPQIRYRYTGDPISFEVAALRPFAGEVAPAVTQADFLSAGEFSRLPFFESRLAYGRGRYTVGISGRYGWLDLREDALQDDETTTATLAGDVLLALGKVGLSGEAFIGRNNRGIGGLAGTTVVDAELIDGKSVGGWAQLSYTVDRVNFNVGYGIEDVEDGILNQTVYGNVIYSLERLPINFALEVSEIETHPAPRFDDFHNLTINFAARYNFSLGLR